MIYIAHLLPSLLNLYGENGNIKAFTYMLEQKKIKYKVDLIELNDKIDFKKYDLIYIGSGRKDLLDVAINYLKPYKEDILKYINDKKVWLATGNSIKVLEFLGLYETKFYDERKVSNINGTSYLCKGTIKGFLNSEYLLTNTSNYLFKLDECVGNNESKDEGYYKNNFLATAIIGPILARNDNLVKYIGKILKKNKVNYNDIK